MKNNTLLIGDTCYELNKAYIEGALALRNNISYHLNPYSLYHNEYNYAQWSSGHCHEDTGCHLINGVDVLLAKKNGTEFRWEE